MDFAKRSRSTQKATLLWTQLLAHEYESKAMSRTTTFDKLSIKLCFFLFFFSSFSTLGSNGGIALVSIIQSQAKKTWHFTYILMYHPNEWLWLILTLQLYELWLYELAKQQIHLFFIFPKEVTLDIWELKLRESLPFDSLQQFSKLWLFRHQKYVVFDRILVIFVMHHCFWRTLWQMVLQLDLDILNCGAIETFFKTFLVPLESLKVLEKATCISKKL